MSPTDFPLFSENTKRTIIPAVIGAGVCLFFIRSGFFSLFFLVPLGVLAFSYDFKTAWAALFLAVLGNAALAIGTAMSRGIPVPEIIWDILYFSVMTSIFTWIIAPPPCLRLNLSGAIRLLTGSCLGAILFAGVFFRSLSSPLFSGYLDSVITSLVSLYRSTGSDVVQNALVESLTPEVILDVIKSILLRGGSLVSCVVLFFFCRQISFALVRLSRRIRGTDISATGVLSAFYVNPAAIWVLSVSLLLLVGARAIKLEIPEIALWNILVLCAIVYFAQGLGIVQFFLSKSSVSSFLRLLLSVLLIVLFFSPVLNLILIGCILLLGIAENWAPFRSPGHNGTPSTPEAGNGDG